jgi:hypothetical protein
VTTVPAAAIWHFPDRPAALPSRKTCKRMKTRSPMLRNLLGLGMILNTESFRKGQLAAREGRPENENPFSDGSAHGSDWKLGWRLAVKMAADNENRRIAAPSIDVSSYEMGRLAARKGVSAALNPYHPGHPSHDQWRLGWASGKAA